MFLVTEAKSDSCVVLGAEDSPFSNREELNHGMAKGY